MRRRRPVAVYRVIDEDELLGGDHIDAPDDTAGDPAPPPPAPAATVRRLHLRIGWPALPGWIVTGIAVAALAVVASLLLHRSPAAPAHAALPGVPGRVAKRARPATVVGSPPPGTQALPRARARATPPARRRSVVVRAHTARRALAARPHASRAAAPIPHGPAVSVGAVDSPAVPAHPVPEQEFGFER